MRFEQLRYFETAVRVGSLRRAAAELGVSQPTLTQQVQRLEEELNIVLLMRRPTGVALTEAGRALLPHVRQALQAENGLYQEAGAITGLHRGRLRLGAIPTAGQMFLPEAVRAFQDKYPGVEVAAIEAGSGVVRNGLLSGEFDLAVLAHWKAGGPLPRDLRAEELFGGSCTVCVPPDHRLADAPHVRVSDLDGESFVVVERGQVLRDVFEHVSSKVRVSVVYETNSTASARRTVEAGVGISIQSALGREEAEDGRASIAIPLAESWASVSIVLCWRRHEQPTPAMVTFMELLREHTRPLREAAASKSVAANPER